MTDLIFSPAAQEDIEDIYEYSVARWGVARAEYYIRGLRDACLDLADGRQQGRDADDIRSGYRKQICGSHFIFFRQTISELEVIRILHQRMDAEGHL